MHEYLGPDVTDGLRWDSNPGPCWSESSVLPLGHGYSILGRHTTIIKTELKRLLLSMIYVIIYDLRL